MDKIVYSEPLPNRDYTGAILNSMLLLHRDLFDILFLTDNRPNLVSDAMRARLYILDNTVVRTFEEISKDQLKACPVLDDLERSLGSIKIRPWTPDLVRESARSCRRIADTSTLARCPPRSSASALHSSAVHRTSRWCGSPNLARMGAGLGERAVPAVRRIHTLPGTIRAGTTAER